MHTKRWRDLSDKHLTPERIARAEKEAEEELGACGWDNPGGTWHYYVGPGPVCGANAPLSLVKRRLAGLPEDVVYHADHYHLGYRICRRCRKRSET